MKYVKFSIFEVFAKESDVIAFRRRYPILTTVILRDTILEQTIVILCVIMYTSVIVVTEK
jgi:hypothetical protein